MLQKKKSETEEAEDSQSWIPFKLKKLSCLKGHKSCVREHFLSPDQ